VRSASVTPGYRLTDARRDSPLSMTYPLTRRTGPPLLEARLSDTRPGFAAGVTRTSGFVPLAPTGAR
jgi:steroid 5-alpha reductase family enzyme